MLWFCAGSWGPFTWVTFGKEALLTQAVGKSRIRIIFKSLRVGVCIGVPAAGALLSTWHPYGGQRTFQFSPSALLETRLPVPRLCRSGWLACELPGDLCFPSYCESAGTVDTGPRIPGSSFSAPSSQAPPHPPPHPLLCLHGQCWVWADTWMSRKPHTQLLEFIGESIRR